MADLNKTRASLMNAAVRHLATENPEDLARNAPHAHYVIEGVSEDLTGPNNKLRAQLSFQKQQSQELLNQAVAQKTEAPTPS